VTYREAIFVVAGLHISLILYKNLLNALASVDCVFVNY
jgi:hypothetical protein